jgi:hypothetical protein
MLLKQVCSQCGHHYLADDQLGEVDCPRCHSPAVGATGMGMPAPVQPPQMNPHAPSPVSREPTYGEAQYPGPEMGEFEMPTHFDPKAPPPMFVTGDRILRGLLVSSIATLLIGAILGGALASLSLRLPIVPALVLGWIAGLSCNRAFGGRAAHGTLGRAFAVVLVGVTVGYAGYLTGGWAMERMLGSRVEQTRADLDRGLKSLKRQRSHISDEGTAIVLDQRIARVTELHRRSDASIEDYLWVQEAQINQPLMAYVKLRVIRGPLVQLGADAKPIVVKRELNMAAMGSELLLAAILAMLLVGARKR